MSEHSERLQIDDQLTFQRREWRLQRAGWFALCAFIVAAILGLFGGGPISHARAGAPGAPLWIEYERFVRQGAAERLTIHLAGPEEDREALDIRVSRRYLESIRIDRIVPEPEHIDLGPVDAVLRFTGTAAQTTSVVLEGEPTGPGRRSATVASTGAPPVSLTQFVYF